MWFGGKLSPGVLRSRAWIEIDTIEAGILLDILGVENRNLPPLVRVDIYKLILRMLLRRPSQGSIAAYKEPYHTVQGYFEKHDMVTLLFRVLKLHNLWLVRKLTVV